MCRFLARQLARARVRVCLFSGKGMVATINSPRLRTVNRFAEAQSDYDIYKHNPWRAPGFAPVLDACGAAGGQPFAPNISTQYGIGGCQRTGCWYHETPFAAHGDLGSQVLAELPTSAVWTIGGEAEVIWQILANHGGGYQYRLCPFEESLDEACFQRTALSFNPSAHSLQFNNGSVHPINGTFVAAGTSPAGSVWAMNPIPPRCLGNNTYNPCSDVHVCTPCPEHLPECTTCGNFPGPSFEPPCDEGGVPNTCSGHAFDAPAPVAVLDSVLVPADLLPGKYVLGWRYDAESTQQVWASCADITLIAPQDDQEVAALAAARAQVLALLEEVSFKPAPFVPQTDLPPVVVKAAASPLLASPVDQPYGYPVSNVPCDPKDLATAKCSFGLIVEERVPYTNGPDMWPANPWGAYAMIDNAPAAFLDGKFGHNYTRCPHIPADSPLAPRQKDLDPYALYQLNGLAWCLLACNHTQVKLTGDDPCSAGSIEGSNMSCYDMGSDLLSHDPSHLGACGYNCSLLRYDVVDAPTPCSEADLSDGLCQVYCDSRTFPGAATK